MEPIGRKIFGFTQEDILGTWAKTVPEELKDELSGLFERSKRGEIIRGYETERCNKAGERFPVSISMAPLYDESMRLIGIVATTEDIRERKRIEQELKQKSAKLSAVTDALNTFLETGDWTAASGQLLSFALKNTKSELGFLGVMVDGPALRVLAQDGAIWSQTLNRELYHSKMRERQENGYFEHEHHKNLLSELIYEAKTVIVNRPLSNTRSKTSPAGHPGLRTFLGVPIFKATEIVGLIAVANRPGGYSEEEVRSLEEVAQATGVLMTITGRT